MLNRFRGLGLLGLVLVACSPQPTPQANATPQETSQSLQALSAEIQQVFQELGNAFQELLPQQLSTLNLNPNSLRTLSELQLDRLFPIQPLDITPLGTQSLPRGKMECVGSNCNEVGPSDDLELRFKKHSTDPWNKLLADWDYSTKGNPSPTVETHPRYNTQDTMETPTKAFFALDFGDNGSKEGEATFTAQWRPSTCLQGKYLFEPQSLGLTGFLDHPNRTQRLVDLRKLSYTSSASQQDLAWNLSLLVQGNDSALHTQGQMTVKGTATPGTCGSLQENFSPSSGQVSITLSTQNHSMSLSFTVPKVEDNPLRIHIQNGNLRVDGKVVTFEGIFDDQNKNCVPGENLTLHFASGQTMSLETFLIQHMGVRPCN